MKVRLQIYLLKRKQVRFQFHNLISKRGGEKDPPAFFLILFYVQTDTLSA